jgi:hypothetical protein
VTDFDNAQRYAAAITRYAAALTPVIRCRDDWDTKCDLDEVVAAAIAAAVVELEETWKWARLCEANNTTAQAEIERLRRECCGMPLDENGRCFHRPSHSQEPTR